MAMTEALTRTQPYAVWAHECLTRRLKAVADLVELVKGPALGQAPQNIPDPILWVHQAFDRYRSGMEDNDRGIHDLGSGLR